VTDTGLTDIAPVDTFEVFTDTTATVPAVTDTTSTATDIVTLTG
jgi:hypothetical protein